jgi:hypothetical protein
VLPALLGSPHIAIDVAFAVYNNIKSHLGAICTLSKRAVITGSTKQTTNGCISIESELNRINNKISIVIWTI